jgi:hypothetical protein
VTPRLACCKVYGSPDVFGQLRLLRLCREGTGAGLCGRSDNDPSCRALAPSSPREPLGAALRGRAAQRGVENQRAQLLGEVGEAEAPRPRRRRERRVRVTVDLTREQHRFLRSFALDADSDGSSVLRALLALLAEDPAIAKDIRARLGAGHPE